MSYEQLRIVRRAGKDQHVSFAGEDAMRRTEQEYKVISLVATSQYISTLRYLQIIARSGTARIDLV